MYRLQSDICKRKGADFMGKITKIEFKIPQLPARKKVAAYARVSMETERLHHSLAAQVSYYSALIQKNPEWEYAGVYADEGITGTAASRRPEFMRMLADCDAGKIDIILTKSISRFARNTVDLLGTVRHLKDLGIEVRFEKEHINSLSGDGEVMLTLLASFAQEETRSISENEKWSVKKRFEQGIPTARPRILGYRWEDDTMVVIPEEAEIVKRIYQNFLEGKSRLETERELAAEGVVSVNGKRMCDSQLKNILTNISYTGNLLLQKEYVGDPISKKRKKNHGELPQYFDGNLAVCAGRDVTPQGACMLCKQIPHAELLLGENQVRQMRTELCTLHEDEQGKNQPAWRALHFLGMHIKEKDELPVLQERHDTGDRTHRGMCKSSRHSRI